SRRRSFALNAAKRQLRFYRLGQLLRERKSKSRSARRFSVAAARLVDPVEALEYMRHLALRYADSFIDNGNRSAFSAAAHTQLDGICAIFAGIVEQDQQELLQHVGIGYREPRLGRPSEN